MYDPQLGRFLSPDPIGEAGGYNLYEAFKNDPVNFVDPDGTTPEPVNNQSGFADQVASRLIGKTDPKLEAALQYAAVAYALQLRLDGIAQEAKKVVAPED